MRESRVRQRAIETFKKLRMVDVQLPSTDGRALTLTRYTQPEAQHRMLLDQLHLQLPAQPPPRISAAQVQAAAKVPAM